MLSKMYSRLLAFVVRAGGFSVLGGRVMVWGDYAYNTVITLQLKTGQCEYPVFNWLLSISYTYDWCGNRTGGLSLHVRHYHFGIVSDYWHEQLGLAQKFELIKQRKFAPPTVASCTICSTPLDLHGGCDCYVHMPDFS